MNSLKPRLENIPLITPTIIFAAGLLLAACCDGDRCRTDSDLQDQTINRDPVANTVSVQAEFADSAI